MPYSNDDSPIKFTSDDFDEVFTEAEVMASNLQLDVACVKLDAEADTDINFIQGNRLGSYGIIAVISLRVLTGNWQLLRIYGPKGIEYVWAK